MKYDIIYSSPPSRCPLPASLSPSLLFKLTFSFSRLLFSLPFSSSLPLTSYLLPLTSHLFPRPSHPFLPSPFCCSFPSSPLPSSLPSVLPLPSSLSPVFLLSLFPLPSYLSFSLTSFPFFPLPSSLVPTLTVLHCSSLFTLCFTFYPLLYTALYPLANL
jgi:hypothetical protein